MVGSSAARDAGLGQLIRLKNYKQALKNVDKKLKKQTNDYDLLTVKADLLLKHGERQECYALCTRLLSQNDTITDLEAVTRLNYVAHRLSLKGVVIPGAQIESLWQRAVKSTTARVAKIDIAKQWMEECISYAQWNHASKAAVLLSKLVPPEDPGYRTYYCWQIVAQWLSRLGPEIKDERMRALGQMMACRMLEKLVAQTPVHDSATSTVQCIARRQDFELLASIYMDSKRDPQLVTAIDEKQLGIHTPPAIDDWGAHQTKLAVFKRLGETDKAWESSKVVLESARDLNIAWKTDDWAYWEVLLQNKDVTKANITRSLASDFMHEQRKARAPAIAVLASHGKALFVNQENKKDAASSIHNHTSSLLDEGKKYYDQFSHQAGCASELEDLLSKLPDELRREFIAYIKSRNEAVSGLLELKEAEQLKWLRREINVLKLDFAWCLKVKSPGSLQEPQKSDTSKALASFIENCLHLYRLSRHQTPSVPYKTLPIGDDACILAVRALIVLWELHSDIKHVVQAACLSTFLLEDSEHNADATLRLINLLGYLGLLPLALQAYDKLDVKSLLIESCAPMLFNRIATMLPFSLDSRDHYKLMTGHLKFYGDSLAQIPRHQVTALDKENYVQAKHFDEFATTIQNSLTRRMLLRERRSITRLRRVVCDEDAMGLEDFPPLPLNAPVNEQELPAASEEIWNDTMRNKILISEPPILTEEYTRYGDIVGDVFSLACSTKRPDASGMKRCGELLALAHECSRQANNSMYLTKWEASQFRLVSSICEVMLSPEFPGAEGSPVLENSVKSLVSTLTEVLHTDFADEDLDLASSDSWPFPRWQLYHQTYVQLELLIVCYRLSSQMLICCKTESMSPPNLRTAAEKELKALQSLTVKRNKDVKIAAAGWKKAVDEASRDEGLAERVLDIGEDSDSKVGHAIYEVMGMQNARRITKSFARQPLVLLDGIFKVEIV